MNKSKIIFKDSVEDIKFAPKHLGLLIACAVATGNVEVYEAKDVQSLVHWNAISTFTSNNTGANCLSWNPTFDEPPMLVVGCNNASPTKFGISNDEERSLMHIFGKKEG